MCCSCIAIVAKTVRLQLQLQYSMNTSTRYKVAITANGFVILKLNRGIAMFRVYFVTESVGEFRPDDELFSFKASGKLLIEPEREVDTRVLTFS